MIDVVSAYIICLLLSTMHAFEVQENSLENQRGTLRLLVATVQNVSKHVKCDVRVHIPQLEMLATLQRQLCLRFTCCAFQSQNHLLRCLCLLLEYGFRLTSISGLFPIVSSLSLGE